MLRESEAAGRDDVGEQNAERWPRAWTRAWRLIVGGEAGVRGRGWMMDWEGREWDLVAAGVTSVEPGRTGSFAWRSVENVHLENMRMFLFPSVASCDRGQYPVAVGLALDCDHTHRHY